MALGVVWFVIYIQIALWCSVTLLLGFVCLLVQCLHIFWLCEFTFVIRAALLLEHDGSRRRHSVLFDLFCCNVLNCFRVFVR